MTRQKTIAAPFLIALFVRTGNVYATDISGIIPTTLTITDNSKLVGDVVCTVTGGPCIAFGASGLTLDLNGYSMTGLGDPQATCARSTIPNEVGVMVNA